MAPGCPWHLSGRCAAALPPRCRRRRRCRRCAALGACAAAQLLQPLPPSPLLRRCSAAAAVVTLRLALAPLQPLPPSPLLPRCAAAPLLPPLRGCAWRLRAFAAVAAAAVASGRCWCRYCTAPGARRLPFQKPKLLLRCASRAGT
eukprot:s1267_g18.t1